MRDPIDRMGHCRLTGLRLMKLISPITLRTTVMRPEDTLHRCWNIMQGNSSTTIVAQTFFKWRHSMKKQWICGYTALLAVILIAGCVQTSNDSVQKELAAQGTEVLAQEPTKTLTISNDKFIEFPSYYTKKEGTVRFNTKLLAGDNGKVKELSIFYVQPITVSHDEVYSCFFSQTELKDTQVLNRKSEDGNAGTVYFYHGKQGDSLSIWETGFSYYSPFTFQISNTFSFEKVWSGYNADLYQRNIDFAVLDHKAALQQVLEQMEIAGFELKDGTYCYQCYSLDYQTLEKEESIIDMDGNQDTEKFKDSWSEDDNCYYFCISQTIDNIPVTYECAGVFGEYNDANAPVQAVVSKEGIKMLTMDKMFQISETSRKVTLLGFEQIANCVKDKFADLLTNSTYQVEQAELVYMSVRQQQGGYEMKPVWVFDIIEKAEGETDGHLLHMIVDARTGEEIVL